MKNGKMLKTGLIGMGITLLCCVTPILVVLFSAVGLSSLVGMLDIFLFPLLALFVALTGYALWQKQKTKSN